MCLTVKLCTYLADISIYQLHTSRYTQICKYIVLCIIGLSKCTYLYPQHQWLHQDSINHAFSLYSKLKEEQKLNDWNIDTILDTANDRDKSNSGTSSYKIVSGMNYTWLNFFKMKYCNTSWSGKALYESSAEVKDLVDEITTRNIKAYSQTSIIHKINPFLERQCELLDPQIEIQWTGVFFTSFWVTMQIGRPLDCWGWQKTSCGNDSGGNKWANNVHIYRSK